MRRFVIYGFILLIGILVYASTLDNFFISDDFNLIYGVRYGGPFGVWSGPGSDFFRPLISLSLWINFVLFGLQPTGYHLTNIALHIITALGVYHLAQIFLDDDALASWAALVFVVMPVHSESVAWVSGRTDVVAGAFAVWSVVLSLRNRWAAASLICALAMLSKEVALTLPLILMACQWRDTRKLWPSVLTGALIPVYFLLRYILVGDLVKGYGLGAHITAGPVKIALAWLRVFVPPLPLTENAVVIVTLTVILAGTIWLLVALIRRPDRRIPWQDVMWFLPALFALAALPASSLVSPQNFRTIQGERLLYWPSTFACIWLAALVGRLAHRHLRWGVAMTVAVLMGLQLVAQNEVWRDASRITGGAVHALTGDFDQDITILGEPPNELGGVHVYRNGRRATACLFQGHAWNLECER